MGEQHSKEWMETVLGALVKAVILRLTQEGHVVIENRDGGLWVRLCEEPYGEASSLSNAAPDLLVACEAQAIGLG